MSIERMQELTKSIDALTQERREIGQSLPPVTLAEVKDDRAFEQAVRVWMRVWMPLIDTTLLDRNDYDKWELLTHRYEERGDRASAAIAVGRALAILREPEGHAFRTARPHAGQTPQLAHQSLERLGVSGGLHETVPARRAAALRRAKTRAAESSRSRANAAKAYSASAH